MICTRPSWSEDVLHFINSGRLVREKRSFHDDNISALRLVYLCLMQEKRLYCKLQKTKKEGGKCRSIYGHKSPYIG